MRNVNKRKVISEIEENTSPQHTRQFKPATRLNFNNKSESPRRRFNKIAIFGSNSNTSIKTGIIPFYVYVGNVALDKEDSALKDFFINNGLNVLNLTRIQTKLLTSKAFKLTIPRDQIDIIKNSSLWPKGMIINKYTFPKLQTNLSKTNTGSSSFFKYINNPGYNKAIASNNLKQSNQCNLNDINQDLSMDDIDSFNCS